MLALLQLLPFLASAQAFFILSQPVLQVTRLDPIVNPGAISGHVHTIAGGSNFNREMSLDSALDSQCTTAPIIADKSNYWIPQLYYYNYKTGGFSAIPVAFINTYYLPRGGGGANETINAFPDGLRMLQGDGGRKTYDPRDPDDMSISYVCLDYSGKHAGDPEWDQRNNFFNHNCPDGLRAQVNFPTCWDGKNIDSGDHRSHLAWPIGADNNGGGPCPASHPVKIVQLFYEFVFQVQDFPFNPAGYPTWVWANGDTTGYGLHADFINGWPKLQNGTNVLQRAINECNINNGVGGNLQDCPPFQGLINNQQAGGCRPENELVDELVGLSQEIPKLPGNNPMWNGQGTNPVDPYYQEPEPLYRDPQSKIPAGYENVGCIAEAASGRALNAYSFSSQNMSKAMCVQACADRKLPLAGIEYGSECYCDMQMRNGASNTTLLDGNTRCNMRCTGKRYENCGGSSTLELYVNKDLFTGPVGFPDKWSAVGCYDGQATSGRALTDYFFADDKMTPQMCTQECAKRGFNYAGIEYGQECRCGVDLKAGSGPKPEGDCSFKCPGDGVFTCGAGNRMNLFKGPNAPATASPSTTSTSARSTTVAATTTAVNSTTVAPTTTTVTAVTTSPTTTPASTTTAAAAANPDGLVPISQVAGWGQLPQNCFTEATGQRALTGFSGAGGTMTIAKCITACNDRGFKFAGLEYARECYCGNELQAGSKLTDASACNMACSGNATEVCGGNNRLNVFQKMGAAATSSTTTSSTVVATSSTTSSTTTAAATSSTTTASSTTSSTSSASPTPNNDNINAPGWVARGCWTEGTSGRALPKFTFTNSKLTNEIALQRCQAAGVRWCGTEYMSEVWGGDAPGNGAKQAPIEQCNLACRGDAMQYCGAANRLSMWEFVGNDTTAAETATTGTATQAKVSASSSTISSSSSSTASSSSTTSSTTTKAATSSTTTAAATTAAVTASTTVVPTTSSSTAAASSATPSAPLPTGWVHLGCMTDGANKGDSRAFMALRTTNSTQTWMSCAQTCADKGFKYAGASYGAECFCDNVMNPATTVRPVAECNSKCPGDNIVTCGGAWRLNVFMLNSTQSSTSPQQQTGSASTGTARPAKRHHRSRAHTIGLGDHLHF